MDRAVDIRLFFPDTYVAGEISRWEIVGAINHDVIVPDQLGSVARAQTRGVSFDRERGVNCDQACPRRISLFPPEIARFVQQLPVQITQIDGILVDNSDGTDTGCSEVEC